jgi:hypothetical protein
MWRNSFSLTTTSRHNVTSAPSEAEALRVRVAELEGLINTPHVDNFFEAVRLEAAHQQERWGSENDAGKEPQDWFWLLGYLGGKALGSFVRGDREKGLHHIISSSAVLLNWHRHTTGEITAMRPGITPPTEPPVGPITQSETK